MIEGGNQGTWKKHIQTWGESVNSTRKDPQTQNWRYDLGADLGIHSQFVLPPELFADYCDMSTGEFIFLVQTHRACFSMIF